VAVLPDRLDFLCITLLFTGRCVRIGGLGGWLNGRQTRTHGVPLILSTFNWVSSKLMYPKVSPAKTPERMTRTGMRHPYMIFFVSGELLSFGVSVTDIADVSGGGGCRGEDGG
jgi:hypothetical protein